jgi:hypothetical protein
MPSLIYITRIRPLSAELAQALESAGSHIKSFGPGEITADECILVMTSEAVLAGLQVAGLASVTAGGAARGSASQATPPLEDIQKHLGTEAAIWNCIKAAGLSESAVRESTAASGQRSAVPAFVPAADSLGFVASQAGLRVLAASQQNAATASQCLPVAQRGAPGSNNNSGVSGLPVPSLRKVISEPGPGTAPSSNQAGSSQEIRSADGQGHKRFWQLAAMVATLLIFAVLLLAGRASILSQTTDVAAVDHRNPVARADSHAAGLVRRISTLRSRPTKPPNGQETPAKPANLATEVRRPTSDYDFVAEDYTTHFDLHTHPGATMPTPDLRRGAQNRLIRKRIVVN